jgi:hypothetical protein
MARNEPLRGMFGEALAVTPFRMIKLSNIKIMFFSKSPDRKTNFNIREPDCNSHPMGLSKYHFVI